MSESKIRLSDDAASQKLKLLVTIVNREKAEYYIDLLNGFEINMQTAMLAHGTADTETLRLLGLNESDKAVILSVVRSDRAPEALNALGRKFNAIRNGKGVAFTVPLTSVTGVAIYRFLSDNRKGVNTWNSHTK